MVVVTDTLSTDFSGNPHLFVSKCTIIPHLEMVVAFSGIARVGHLWSLELQTQVLARDIDLLSLHVPDALIRIVDGLKKDYGELPSTSTVYHFGYSGQEQRHVGYAFRSVNRFKAESIQNDSFGVKPEPRSLFEVPNNWDDFVMLARRIRDEQDSLPLNQRLHIGGELCRTVLQDRSIQASKLFRFEDFEDQWRRMNENLHG